MFASDKQSGFTLFLFLALLVVLTIIIQQQSQKISNLLRMRGNLEEAFDRRAWARAIAERIDCGRVMGTYSVSNLCPAGTSRTISFIGDAPLSATGPNSSQFLAKDWYVKTVCGVTDLDVRLARYVGGAFLEDAATGMPLNFANVTTKVSDKFGGTDICKAHFVPGQVPARIVTMTTDTLQYLAASILPSGQNAVSGVTNCGGYIGLNASLDDFPLDPMWRDSGVSGDPNTRSYFANHQYTMMRGWFDNTSPDWGSGMYVGQNMQPNWPLPALYIGEGNSMCNSACMTHFNAGSGRILKCDPTISPSTPPFKSWAYDQDFGQATCLCLK